MWHPPERIRHAQLPAVWPTQAEAAASRWFAPIQVGAVRLRHRTWVPAMVPWRANEAGEVTDDVLDWYGRFARGRPGALVVEATGVRDVPSGPLLRIGHDRFVPGLTRLVERVRRDSGGKTRLFLQIIDFLSIRRRPEPEKFFRRFLVITDRHRAALRDQARTDEEIREALLRLPPDAQERVLDAREWEALRMGSRECVTDLEHPHIRELPRVLPGIFAAAARRAEQAGFDGVELHYAHAYTMASFLSARNDRNDGYGGPREHRVRLPLEVFGAVRAATSAEFAVGCRFLTDEIIPGGNRVEDACAFGVAFARAGMDFLSLSRGGKFEDARQPEIGHSAYPYTGPSGYECMPTVISDAQGPYGRNLAAASQVRAAVRAAGFTTPTVVAGGIATFDQAEQTLAQEQADIVASARQSLADPDWFLKVRLGRGAEVRRCVFTNYCEGLDQKHKQVSCQLWARANLDDPTVRLASTPPRRRLLAPEWKERPAEEELP